MKTTNYIPDKLSDEQLVTKILNGDKELFGKIIDRYEKKLLRYAKRFLFNQENSADLVQDVFIKTYVNLADFNTERKFSSWIYRIAHNCYINELKKQKLAPLIAIDMDVMLPVLYGKENPEQDFADQETKKTLDKYLEKLDIKYKEVIILYFYEDLSYKEIADILHIPIASVGIRLNRGKKYLRQLMNH